MGVHLKEKKRNRLIDEIFVAILPRTLEIEIERDESLKKDYLREREERAAVLIKKLGSKSKPKRKKT